MHRVRDEHREIGAAQRGHLIQRVLVDGWSPAEAAQLIGVDEHRLRRWIADYRRHGMASLRAGPVEKTPRRWLAWAQAQVSRLMARRLATAERAAPAPCVELRSGDRQRRR